MLHRAGRMDWPTGPAGNKKCFSFLVLFMAVVRVFWFTGSLGASPQLQNDKKRRHSSSTSTAGQSSSGTNHSADKGTGDDNNDTPGFASIHIIVLSENKVTIIDDCQHFH